MIAGVRLLLGATRPSAPRSVPSESPPLAPGLQQPASGIVLRSRQLFPNTEKEFAVGLGH